MKTPNLSPAEIAKLETVVPRDKLQAAKVAASIRTGLDFTLQTERGFYHVGVCMAERDANGKPVGFGSFVPIWQGLAYHDAIAALEAA